MEKQNEKRASALSISSGEIRLDERALAKADPDIALRLGLLGLYGDLSGREAGRRLAKAGLLEIFSVRGAASSGATDAFRWLCGEGDLAWAPEMRAWALKNAKNILAGAGKKAVSSLEEAYPGFLKELPDRVLALNVLATEGLFHKGELSAERIEGMLRSMSRDRAPGRAAEALCADLAPEESASAWGAALTRGGGDKLPAWELQASWAEMGEREGAVAAEGIAAAFESKKRVGALRIIAEAAGLTIESGARNGALDGGSVFLGALGRACAEREIIGRKALSWTGARETAFEMPRGGGKAAMGQPEKVADLPLEWLLKARPYARQRLGGLALAWWKGWRAGGGESPGMRVEMPSAVAGDEIPREGPEVVALFLSEAKCHEAARWLLCESGWSSAAGLARVREVAGNMEVKTDWSMGSESLALLEAAEIGLAASSRKSLAIKSMKSL